MTKRIVFGEGKNDLALLENVIHNAGRSVEADSFVGKDVATEHKGKESRTIRNFSENRNPYELLIKSEGGKPELMRMFSRLLVELYPMSPSFNLLIDLDGGDFESILEEINERCRERFTKSIVVQNQELIVSNTHVVGNVCSVTLNGDLRDSFGVLGFRHSMEIAAGINKDDDNHREIAEKINSLSDVQDLKEAVDAVFFRDE